MTHSAPTRARQTVIGLSISTALIAAWLAIHIVGIHGITLSARTIGPALLLAAIQCWLSVGLFIIAHDAIHGSLAPGRPGVNRRIGQLCMTLYAGFSYDKLAAAHHDHHAGPGTADDPDFDADHPDAFWPWYRRFFLRYFGWRPLIFVHAVVLTHWLILGAPAANIVLFYGIPALGSSLQLFYFGTFLPHRHDEAAFSDRHNARSSRYPVPVSLFTCYHFGYHHEHHLFPHEPWWRLPSRRLGRKGRTS